jgi:hypothetical protein
MTAVQVVKIETRSERQARERLVWIDDAVAYLIAIGVYAPDEFEGAKDLAENLHCNLVDEDGEIDYTPQESVDEELTYWGD